MFTRCLGYTVYGESDLRTCLNLLSPPYTTCLNPLIPLYIDPISAAHHGDSDLITWLDELGHNLGHNLGHVVDHPGSRCDRNMSHDMPQPIKLGQSQVAPPVEGFPAVQSDVVSAGREYCGVV